MDKKVECKYRITATVKADTIYELEAIKENLIKAGATILHIDPITIVGVRDAGQCARGTSQREDNKAIAAVNISADALQDMIDDILAAVGLDTGQPVVRR